MRCRLTLPPLYPAGGLPSLSPAYPAFSLLYCPHPPDPRSQSALPGGKGETKSLFCRGLRPRHPCPEPPAALTDPTEAAPCGGTCLLCRLLPLPLACFVAPILPTPFPSGEGGDQGYFMQGASPLASPALDRLRHLQTLPKRHPVGGLPSVSPAAPAFGLLCCPHPPDPRSQSALPGGKGETLRLFRRGLPPPAPLP